jgi:FKBP-type peptidyl-prolyl cis-trans isomerase SlyD
MKSGDFVSIDYVGRVKDTGEIFDLTIEEIAKKEKVFNHKVSYKPIKVVVDGGFVIKGLEDALKEMKIGEKKTILIEPANAFGERDAKLIRPMPISNFRDEKVDPTPGSFIMINGIRGKILSADGGRIRVDFNHPLAGKKLEYDLELKGEITDTVDRVRAVASFVSGVEEENVDAKLNGNEAEVSIKTKHDDHEHELSAAMKKNIADLVIKWVPGVEKIRFVEEYSAAKPK